MTRLVLLLTSIASIAAPGQELLHFTRTSGFDHGTRDVALAMFQQIAADLGLTVVEDDDGSQFSTLAGLAQFDVVIFSNTSGDAILDPVQQANFEAYIAGGGSAMGIHAASDTYRHSSANGTNTGAWDFYAELIGASVQQDPNHVNGTPLYDLSHVGAHQSTTHLPDPWAKEEEYYYWENGYYRPDNIAVLMVEETVGPNDSVNTYDAPRPMSWYRELAEGGRVFYTALGHAPGNYSDDTLFRTHVRDALLWVLHLENGINETTQVMPTVHPDPVSDLVTFSGPPGAYELLDACGSAVERFDLPGSRSVLDLSNVPNGLYLLRWIDGAICARLIVQH